MNWKTDRVDIIYDFTVEKHALFSKNPPGGNDLIHRHRLNANDTVEIQKRFKEIGLDALSNRNGTGCGCLSKYRNKISEEQIKEIISDYFETRNKGEFKVYFKEAYLNKYDTAKAARILAHKNSIQKHKSNSIKIKNGSNSIKIAGLENVNISESSVNKLLLISIILMLVSLILLVIFKHPLIIIPAGLFGILTLGALRLIKIYNYKIKLF